MQNLALEEVDALIRRELEEDVGSGDVTSEAIGADVRARGRLHARREGVVCGLAVFRRAFELVDPSVSCEELVADGTRVRGGDELCRLEGPARALLQAERTALNFLGRLSGVATLTALYVGRSQGARVLDTRKTTPGMRKLERYAVRCGGGENHRFGLFDQALLKDNHLDLARRPPAELVRGLRARHGPRMRIICEARNEAEALSAVEGGADVVLLDNLGAEALEELCPRLRSAAQERGAPVEIEASGGVDLESVPRIAGSGVDRVSVGALTHSAPSLDLSLTLERL